MNIKHIFIIFLITYFRLNSSFLFAQNEIVDPITSSNSTFGIINSDLGPRHHSSKYHTGIDYRCQRGSKAFAVENSYVKDFVGWGQKWAYIKVEGIADITRIWRYMHVEDDSYRESIYNKKIWEYCPNFYGRDVEFDDFILLREVTENGTLISDRAIATTKYKGTEYFVTDSETNQEIPLLAFVYQGDWIFMPRNLAAPHLHLDREKNLSYINPLADVPYSDSRAPVLENTKIKRSLNNQASEFVPENIIYGSPIILESKVNTTVDKDFDLFEVLCTSQNDNSVNFKKEWRISKKTGSTNLVKKANVILAPEMNNEDWIINNINEAVYPYDPNNTADAKPGHDYFKLHWPSNESIVEGEPLAYTNVARYPDGQYSVIFKAEDISSNGSTKQMIVMLDNHIPFVKAVQIENGNTIYSSQINYVNPENPTNSNRGKFVRKDSDHDPACADFQNDLDFYVSFSEPMQEVNIEIHEGSIDGQIVYEGSMQQWYNSNENWKHSIDKDEFDNFFYSMFTYWLRISGHDMAGNEIMYLGLEEDDDEGSLLLYPYRDPLDDYAWSVPNYLMDDRDHWFSFCNLDRLRSIFTLENAGGNLKTTTGDPVYGHSPLTINFTDASTGSPENWTWDFGDNSLPVKEQNITHTFVNETDEPIQYNVSLKVCNEGGCDVAFKSKLITVYPEGYSNIPIADFTFTQETYAQPFYVEFNNYSVGNINTTKWDFGDNTFSSDENPDPHQYSTPGTYIVKLVLNEDAAEESVYEQEIEVLEGSSNFGPIDFEWACIANINNMQNGEGLNGELIDFKSTDYFYTANYEWDMGDGIGYYTSSPSHAYLNTGTYAVSLSITNFYGELIGKKTKWVTVLPKNKPIPAAENEIAFNGERWIEDIEITNDNEFLFVVPEGNTVYLYNYSSTSETWEEYNAQPTISFDHNIGNITVSGDLLLVSCPLQDDFNGKVYFYKRISSIWVKQAQELMPDDYWLRYGQFMDMEDGIVLVSAFNEQGKHYQISIMEYDQNTNQWQVLDKKYTNPHPGPPKISYSNGLAAINSDVYKKPSNGTWWPKVEDAVLYNAGYIRNGEETITVGSKYLASSVQDMENPYISVFVHNGSDFTALPSIKITNDNMPFANGLSSHENYLASGNWGSYILNCDNFESLSESSLILFRANSNNSFYRYLTTSPTNGIIGDKFGEIVRINDNSIIISSQRVVGGNGNIIKNTGVYFYNNYAYFGDRELNIYSMLKYRTKNNEPLRFEARNIEIGGSTKSSVISGDDLDLIGQRVVLSPGFSATSGAVFKATGTICTDFYESATSKGIVNEDLNETVYLSNIENPNQQYENSFIIAPNPGTNYINIKATDNTVSIKKVEIYDLSGKIVIAKESDGGSYVLMDISTITKGVYIAVVHSEGLPTRMKFIKL